MRGGVALPAHTLESSTPSSLLSSSSPLFSSNVPHTQSRTQRRTHARTHNPAAPFWAHRRASRGSPSPLLPRGLSSTLQLPPIDTLLAAKGSVREIRQTLGMAVTTKQWINTDMHLFIYIRNGPHSPSAHSALSSARTYVGAAFIGGLFERLLL